MEETEPQEIYDIYVINKAGLPLFSGCTATEYCLAHMGQHELVSGFISAMMSFSKESFKDSDLESLLFDDITVNFTKDEEKGLIFTFVHSKHQDHQIIRENLEKAATLFIDKFGDDISDNYVDESLFHSFRDVLRSEKIIPNINNTIGYQEETEERKSRRPRLSAWFNKFRSK